MHRGEKPLDKNTVVFRCEQSFTKPELRQYFEKSIDFIYKIPMNFLYSIWIGGSKNQYCELYGKNQKWTF